MKMGLLLFFNHSTNTLLKGVNRMESMELSCAEKLIGVGNKYDMKHVLNCFEIVHWAKKENREFDLIPPAIEAKNAIMRHLVTEQKRKYRFFEIESPFPNTCPKCKGSGEIYKFFKKTVKVNCHICGGASKVLDKCPKCKGSGRYVRRWRKGGGIDLKCQKCEGTGHVKISCLECVGKGQLKKAVLSDEIKSTTPCKRCQQLGFVTKQSSKPKKKKSKRKKKSPFQPFPMTSRDGKNLSDVIKGS